MSLSKNKLVTAINNYLLKIEDKLKATSAPVFFEQNITITASEVKLYDLKTVVTDHELFHMMSADVKVLVKDIDPTSNTYDSFINSEAVITTAIEKTGVVKVHNSSDVSQEIVVKIYSPSIKK